MDKKTAADKYREIANKLAYKLVDIQDLEDSASFIAEQMQDNGDPKFALHDAIRYIGIALAHSLCYANEYQEEYENEKKEIKS